MFVRLRFLHRGKSRTHLLALAGLTVASEEFDRLNVDGARLISPQARRELIDRIQATPEEGSAFPRGHPPRLAPPRLRPAGRGDQCRRQESVGAPRRRRPARALRPLPHRRHLDGWQEIARLAVGNSLMELGLCLAFAGPVAALLGVEQPGIMLVGAPGSWKSTLLAAVASVWGRHADPNMANKLGFCVPFNATVNDLEDEALAANHTLLAVDETRAADGGGDERKIAKFLVGAVMRWELGFEKGRKTADRPAPLHLGALPADLQQGARRAGGAGRNGNRRRPPRPSDRRAAARLRRQRLRGPARRGRRRGLRRAAAGAGRRAFRPGLPRFPAPAGGMEGLRRSRAAGSVSGSGGISTWMSRSAHRRPRPAARPRPRENGHRSTPPAGWASSSAFSRGRRSGCWRRCCRAPAATWRWWPARRPAPRGGKRRRLDLLRQYVRRELQRVRRPAARGN